MTRSQLIHYFSTVRQTSERLCSPLETEDYTMQPIVDVSPPKWHLGHTSWFFEALFLQELVPDYKPYHPRYGFVFNSYYDSFGRRVDRPRRGTLSRPTVKEVFEYRRHISTQMIDLIQSIGEEKWQGFSNNVVLALNHEQQHQELLLSDIKYILAQSPLKPVYQNAAENLESDNQNAPPKSAYVEFPGGVYEIGYQGNEFFYDNERPVHKQFLQDFRLQNRLVTNGEYLEFIEDGGYTDFRFWLSDGWERVQAEQWQAPLFWEKLDGQWYEWTLSGLRKLDLFAPVCHVSYLEADAYAQWAKKRLPTEAEWEVAARLSGASADNGNFMGSKLYHPRPLKGSRAAGSSEMHQMLGDVWEWTASAYLPYPGYRRLEGPLGEYNGKFMVNQMVLRGGSCTTPQDHIRISYRNFFQPEKRWQFMGFRLAEPL